MYAWLGDIPGMREWIGDREVQNLTASDYTIKNKDFELTVGVDRNAIEDDIVLEALTQPGDLFYDAEFGWGLYDFIQSEDTELTRLEMTQRVKSKLQRREVILPETIGITITRADDTARLRCTFRFAGEDEARTLNIVIDAVSVEVIAE